jgi:hypothetical protein
MRYLIITLLFIASCSNPVHYELHEMEMHNEDEVFNSDFPVYLFPVCPAED